MSQLLLTAFVSGFIVALISGFLIGPGKMKNYFSGSAISGAIVWFQAGESDYIMFMLCAFAGFIGWAVYLVLYKVYLYLKDKPIFKV